MAIANDNSASEQFSELRQRAENALQKRPSDSLELAELTNKEIHGLLHELKTHQIELEIQNDELRRTQLDLEAVRDKYTDLYDLAPVGYFTISAQGLVEEANLTGADLLSIDRQSLIGKPLAGFISAKDQDTFYFHRMQILKKNGNHSCEIKMRNYDNTPFYALLESIAVRGADENGTKLRTAITDITDRKMTDQQLRISLKEKEVLLQEVHHRVKNNMQVMISLINLQCEKIEDKHICDLFNKTVNRINSMALVHKQLYKSKDFSKVAITEYITSIVDNLFASYSVDTSRISLKIDKSDIALSLDNTISCGLIINELITNSLKYAFPEDRKGEIRVEFGYSDDGQLEMGVSDNGAGMPLNVDVRDSDTLGVQIVKSLAEHQLAGTVELDSTKGTKFLIRFRERSR